MFEWIQNQLLSMHWLNTLVGNGLVAIGLSPAEPLFGILQFFIYDTIKIFILLSVLIFSISYVQSYFPPERTKQILGRFRGIGANTLAALLGTITPFCSCSSIPLFMGFTSAGLSIGVTFSFLISSPMVDLATLLLLSSIFGAKMAFTYVVVGLIIAIIGGVVLEKLNMERYVDPLMRSAKSSNQTLIPLTRTERLQFAYEQLRFTIKKVTPYLLIGVGIGALIHNVVPAQWIENVLGSDNAFSVLIATIVGVPIYADIFGVIPIAESLLDKQAGIGTVMAFMMAVTTLSLPSLVLLRRAVQPPLLVAFVVVCVIGILMTGYIFNFAGAWLMQ